MKLVVKLQKLLKAVHIVRLVMIMKPVVKQEKLALNPEVKQVKIVVKIVEIMKLIRLAA